MKIWEIRLQNGIFVYKAGISFTKWDFHLQRETLGLQTGLSLYISPYAEGFWCILANLCALYNDSVLTLDTHLSILYLNGGVLYGNN